MSRVESLVKQKLSPRAGEVAPTANRITVRLDDRAHWKLVTMSTRFGMSKSATAEDLIESAIDDAFKLFFNMLDDDGKAEILHDPSFGAVEDIALAEALDLAGGDEALQRLGSVYELKHTTPARKRI